MRVVKVWLQSNDGKPVFVYCDETQAKKIEAKTEILIKNKLYKVIGRDLDENVLLFWEHSYKRLRANIEYLRAHKHWPKP